MKEGGGERKREREGGKERGERKREVELQRSHSTFLPLLIGPSEAGMNF
jgi:hypothetical protein